MGNHSYKLSQLKVIKPTSDHWKTIHKNQLYEIVCNIHTGIKGQKYNVTISDIVTQAELYQIRHNNPKYFVSVHQISLNKQQLLCSNTYSLEVITQHVQYRLADVGIIQKLEATSILMQLLESCQKIYEYFGVITFDENMICRCSDNRWKLWVNQNIEKNSIQNFSEVTIKQMIQNLFALVIQRCPSLSYEQNPLLKKIFRQKLTFLEARKYVNEISQQQKKRLIQVKFQTNIKPIKKQSQLTFKTNFTKKQITDSTTYALNSPSSSQIFELWSQKDNSKNRKSQDKEMLKQQKKDKISLATSKKQNGKFFIKKKQSKQKKQGLTPEIKRNQPDKFKNSLVTGAISTVCQHNSNTPKQIFRVNSAYLREIIESPEYCNNNKRHRSSKLSSNKKTQGVFKYKSAQRKNNQIVYFRQSIYFQKDFERVNYS